MRSFPMFAALALVSCGTEAEVQPSVQTLSNGVTVEGTLPADADVEALAAQVPAGGFGVVVDPITGDAATLTRDADVRARIASGEFSVTTAATCTDCGDPTCASFDRTIAIGITQDTGGDGLPYIVQTASSSNFSAPVSSPGTWTSAVGTEIVVSTTGTLSDCSTFGYFFDVVEEAAPEPITIFEENFDTEVLTGLPSTGPTTQAAFESGLPDWAFANGNGSFQVGTGSSTTGGIYSFGAAAAPDRALGGLRSGSTGVQHWGFCVENPGPATWTDLELSFVGEQWRQIASAELDNVTVEFATNLNTAGLRGGDLTDDGLWTLLPLHTFTAPGNVTTGAVDGNLAANQDAISGPVVLAGVNPGESVCFRFVDNDITGSDHGLAIDDLVLTAVEN